jgi:lysyl-tRNA synthetase class 2
MSNEKEQTAQREAKLAELVALGVTPYPNHFERTHDVSAIVDTYGAKDGPELEALQPTTRTAGRVLGMRTFG